MTVSHSVRAKRRQQRRAQQEERWLRYGRPRPEPTLYQKAIAAQMAEFGRVYRADGHLNKKPKVPKSV